MAAVAPEPVVVSSGFLRGWKTCLAQPAYHTLTHPGPQICRLAGWRRSSTVQSHCCSDTAHTHTTHVESGSMQSKLQTTQYRNWEYPIGSNPSGTSNMETEQASFIGKRPSTTLQLLVYLSVGVIVESSSGVIVHA